jgi:RNA-directed DNA polymerase
VGIPTIKDRVVQTAVKLVLEPIFEADFTENAYGYRPQRSAVQAVKAVHQTLKAGFCQVVDADLSKYFDTIPHAELMRSVSRRVSDGSILHLVKMWLKAPVEENNDKGTRTQRGSSNRGTPQGGVLSPLLANIYMRRFLKAWQQRGLDRQFASRIVNYADDFVILCRRDAAQALDEARRLLQRIGLCRFATSEIAGAHSYVPSPPRSGDRAEGPWSIGNQSACVQPLPRPRPPEQMPRRSPTTAC